MKESFKNGYHYFFAFVMAFIGGIIWYSIKWEEKRSKNLDLVAKSLGFSYEKEGDLFLDLENKSHFFSSSFYRRSYFSDFLKSHREEDSIPVCSCKQVTGSAKNRQTHHYTYFIFKNESLNLPHFFYEKRNSFI